MKNYNKVDLFRLICSFFVVFIHMGIEHKSTFARMFIVCFCRQAVPYFFIVSGFFFHEKYVSTQDKLGFTKEYALKLFKYYFIWICFQIPMLLEDYLPLYADRSPVYLAAVLVRRIIFAGTAPFWYLLALAETGLIAGILLRIKKNIFYVIAAMGWISGFLYTLNIPALSVYNNAIYTIFSWQNNFLMAGLPYFAVGVFINSCKEDIRIPAKYSLIALLLSYALTVSKFYITEFQNVTFLKYLPVHILTPVSMFLYAISGEYSIISTKAAQTMRTYSSVIFCLHIFILTYILGNIIPRTYITIPDFVSTITVCIIIGYIVQKSKWKQLTRLLTIK